MSCSPDQERLLGEASGGQARSPSPMSKFLANLPLPFTRQKPPVPQSPPEVPVVPAPARDTMMLPERSKKSRLGPHEGFMPLRPDIAQDAAGAGPSSGLPVSRGRRNVAEACESGSGRADLWLLEPSEEGDEPSSSSHDPHRSNSRRSSTGWSFGHRCAPQAPASAMQHDLTTLKTSANEAPSTSLLKMRIVQCSTWPR